MRARSEKPKKKRLRAKLNFSSLLVNLLVSREGERERASDSSVLRLLGVVTKLLKFSGIYSAPSHVTCQSNSLQPMVCLYFTFEKPRYANAILYYTFDLSEGKIELSLLLHCVKYPSNTTQIVLCNYPITSEGWWRIDIPVH